jgi:alanine racemase
VNSGLIRLRPTFAQISLANLRHNIEILRALSAAPFFCPMVKANAYGHGDIEVTRVLRDCGVTHVGVALIEEGIRLRQSGDRQGILVFAPFDLARAKVLVEHDLTLVASDFAQLEALSELAPKPSRRPLLHLKFNTGMNRRGFRFTDAKKVREWIDQNPAFDFEGIATHLFQGEDAGRPHQETERQLTRLAEIAGAFDGVKLPANRPLRIHALNSAGLSNLPGHTVGARPGIAVYGAASRSAIEGRPDLKPVMSLKTAIVEFQRAQTGEGVSYGATWKVQRDSLLGILPIGYADGYNRLLSNRSSVLVQGRRAPVVGRVCMDYVMIDLTDIVSEKKQSLSVAEEVVLIGSQGDETILAEELADLVGTVSYEILTGISSRVPREYIG